MKIKKILHVIDNINIDTGVATVVMNIYRNIDKEKYQFDFLVSKRGYDRGKTYESEIIKLGGKIYYFGAPLSKEIFRATYNAKQFFKKHANEYDVVHLHTPTIAEFTIKYAKKYGVKSIITHSHSAMTSTNIIKSKINEVLISRIKRYTNNYWACSKNAAKFLFKDTENVEIVKNAICANNFLFDKDIRDEERKNLNISDKKVFVHISNFTTIKNIKFVLPVIEKIKNNNSNVFFIFVGMGATYNEIVEKCKELKISDVCLFVGNTEKISKYLHIADVFFMPSILEGFGVAAVEAQANGLKCILSQGVPKEVKVGDVEFLRLEEKIWYDNMKNIQLDSDMDRKKKSEEFLLSDLNIVNKINTIENLYNQLKQY